MRKIASRWTSIKPREFVAGDIICNKEKQDYLRLIVHVDDMAIWVTGLVHCSLTENDEKHPIYPIYFTEIENEGYEPLLKLGNLKDYSLFIENIQKEVSMGKNSIDGYYR